MANRVILKVPEEEKLVLEDRSTKSAAHTIIIKTLVGREAVVSCRLVYSIVVAVLIIKVCKAVVRIRSAFDDLIELSPGGMAEIRRELVLEKGEFCHRIVWHVNERAGDGFVVIVHALNREVVVPRTLATNRGAGSCADTAAARHSGRQERKV